MFLADYFQPAYCIIAQMAHAIFRLIDRLSGHAEADIAIDS